MNFKVLLLLLASLPLQSWSADYPAKLVRVLDGDTAQFMLDVYMGKIFVLETIRLRGVNAPESRAPAPKCEIALGKKATELSVQFLSGKTIVVTVEDDDKYGRVLGDAIVDGKAWSKAMLDAELVQPYSGGKRSAWCKD